MCEANVYSINENGKKELILESVDKVIPKGNEIFLENIYSQRKTVKGTIKEMALVEHKIFLELNE
ncbi:MAG TPA: CooT family nickel-binding protein [Anaerovoracaceae bacterium]|nr:CooT family nickel-binding protein [Anaerovoracaceae bacterium]